MAAPAVRLVSPGIATSAGHDKVMDLARAALPPYVPVVPVRLKPASGPLLPRLGWEALEGAKVALAALDGQNGPLGGILIRGLEAGSVRARSNGGFSNLLTGPYRQILRTAARSEGLARVLSSHYLALIGRPPGWPASLLGPDLLAQPAVEAIEPPRMALSPCRSYSDALVRSGFTSNEVIESGPFLGDALHRARAERWRRREAVHRGDAPPELFIAVGGSAPEAAAVVELARRLSRQGLRIHVLVGDGRRHAIRLRTTLSEFDDVLVYGGRFGYTRTDELIEFRRLLERPELTAWATRPNEGSVLALALGFELWTLPPYQPHERAASVVLRERGVPGAEELLTGDALGSRLDDPAEGFLPIEPPHVWMETPELRAALLAER